MNQVIFNCIILLSLTFSCADFQEIKSSDFRCANSYVTLECPKGHSIFVTKTEHLYRSSQCYDDELVDYNSDDLPSQDHCRGYDERCEYYKSKCNGKESCQVKAVKKSHQTGVFGGNCDFQSNIVNVLYTCVPNELNKEITSFDICHDSPRDIFELNEGFIHSPNYPYYYQNSKNCQMNIRTHQQRLVIYMLRLNMEGKGMFSRKPNDFLQVQGGEKFHGKNLPAQVIYNGTEKRVELNFQTDWGTSTYLDFPKGFLLYFKLESPPTTTTTTTTTTTSTTTTSTTTTTNSTIAMNKTGTPSDHEIKKEVIYVNSDSQRGEAKQLDNNSSSVVAILVSVIGLLVVIIFTLLLLFRRKQSQFNEEDNIYDTSKSVYQDESVISQSSPSTYYGKFSSKLDKLYRSMTHTTEASKSILNRSVPQPNMDAEQMKVAYEISEYDQKRSISFKHEKTMPTNEPNIENNQSQQNRISKSTVRAENEYVIMPISGNNESLNESENRDKASADSSLKIYEVNLDNQSITINETEPSLKSADWDRLNSDKKDMEIYQSIGDIENYMKIDNNSDSNRLIKNQRQSDVYSTPTNMRVQYSAANIETPINVQNYSNMQLLEEDDDLDDSKA